MEASASYEEAFTPSTYNEALDRAGMLNKQYDFPLRKSLQADLRPLRQEFAWDPNNTDAWRQLQYLVLTNEMMDLEETALQKLSALATSQLEHVDTCTQSTKRAQAGLWLGVWESRVPQSAKDFFTEYSWAMLRWLDEYAKERHGRNTQPESTASFLSRYSAISVNRTAKAEELECLIQYPKTVEDQGPAEDS